MCIGRYINVPTCFVGRYMQRYSGLGRRRREKGWQEAVGSKGGQGGSSLLLPLAPASTRPPYLVDSLRRTHTHTHTPPPEQAKMKRRRKNRSGTIAFAEKPTGAFPRPSVRHVESRPTTTEDDEHPPPSTAQNRLHESSPAVLAGPLVGSLANDAHRLPSPRNTGNCTLGAG